MQVAAINLIVLAATRSKQSILGTPAAAVLSRSSSASTGAVAHEFEP